MSFRIGFGYDVHELKLGEPFVLGGVNIDHSKGPVGHSDADVLIHAICDALLGAAALGDIGHHFPDTSDEFKNIDSKVLLDKVNMLLVEKNLTIANIDSTVCLQKPKISSRIKDMRKCLAHILNLDLDQISIKATTTEKLGFIGKEEGISAYAVTLIK